MKSKRITYLGTYSPNNYLLNSTAILICGSGPVVSMLTFYLNDLNLRCKNAFKNHNQEFYLDGAKPLSFLSIR